MGFLAITLKRDSGEWIEFDVKKAGKFRISATKKKQGTHPIVLIEADKDLVDIRRIKAENPKDNK